MKLICCRSCRQFCALAADSANNSEHAFTLKHGELFLVCHDDAFLPPTHQRRKFAFHGGDDCDPAHAFTMATCPSVSMYPCVWNQSIARRKASSTGRTLYPSSCSALEEDANIFLRPIFTASMVALGSLP